MKNIYFLLFLVLLSYYSSAQHENNKKTINILRTTSGITYLTLNDQDTILDTIYAFAYSVKLLDFHIVNDSSICFIVAGCYGECVTYHNVYPNNDGTWVDKKLYPWMHRAKTPLPAYRIVGPEEIEVKNSKGIWVPYDLAWIDEVLAPIRVEKE